MRSCITGKEVAEFIGKYSIDELKTMTQGMNQCISKVCETFSESMEAIVTAHPELFIINRVHVKLEVEDAFGKPVQYLSTENEWLDCRSRTERKAYRRT